jgi:hypothetical protein
MIELHPGSGMYDCLGVWKGDLDVQCQFNLAGTSLAFGHALPPSEREDRPDWWREELWTYPQMWLQHDLVNELQLRIGLQVRDPGPARPNTIALGVIAELAARLAFGEERLRLRSGWNDSSGPDGCYVRDWCPDYTGPDSWKDWKNKAKWATRFWALSRSHQGPRLVIDLKTGAVQGGMDLWEMYRKGAGIREMAWGLEGAWRALEE